MIGIVVVSHSRSLARAAVALAGEMLHDRTVRIEIAAGLDETTLGTDAVAVAEAIVAADTGDGVLILMDLGSAVLSAELALDLLESPHRTRLCAAPIVEGLVAAAVSAAGEADLDEAADEADNALLGKRVQLGAQSPAGGADLDAEISAPHGGGVRGEETTGDAELGKAAQGARSGGVRGADAAEGAELNDAARAADNALLGKRVQLGAQSPAGGADLDEADSELHGAGVRAADTTGGAELGEAARGAGSEPPTGVVATFTVTNPHGLHARPASVLVAEVRGRDAQVRLRNLTTGAGPVAGASLTRIAALGVLAGHRVEISATGADAQTVVDGVIALAENRFGEDAAPESDPCPAADVEPQDGRETGISRTGAGPFPASAGIAIGPVWRPETVEFTSPTDPAGDPESEWDRLRAAIAEARRRIEAAIDRVDIPTGTSPEAEIFRAHLLLLDDDELIGAVRDRVAGGAAVERAWAEVLDDAAADVARLSDEYLRGRAADIRAVRDQVLGALLGRDGEIISRPGILVADDLTPGQVAALDREIVTGIVLAQGSPTAHSAILARSKGIPAIVGAGPRVLAVAEGTTVGFDGGTGRLAIDPDPDTLAELTMRATEQHERRVAAAAAAWQPARTLDGVSVHVAANVGSVADAADAVRGGADLAGLVRTEFLFLNRDHAPTVDEQERVYREIAEAFGDRRIILRTLDVGGDKSLPYVRQPHEANPFLGLRGIRLALAHPELLRDQLRAIVRVAADHPVSLMFPMISAVDEVHAARKILNEIAPQDISIELGIMVEIPATAAKAAAFAPHVDFFSIGTNDLTQYALAAERGNEAVAALSDPLDPGVLHLIDRVCRGAGETRVAVCGEIAADPVAIPLLLGLGVTELSVAPLAIALTKEVVRDLALEKCVMLARRALTLESAAEVRAAVATKVAP